MRRRVVALTCAIGALMVAGSVLGACGGSGDGASDRGSTTTTVDVAAQVRTDLGALHRSTIQEVPGLIALFYHHPDGWAVEDVSLDNGATWCRHAWYQWELTDVVAPDDFTVRYLPSAENPACVPLGEPLILDVTGRTTRDGQVVLTGEYASQGLHAERTVCPGTIDDFRVVCDHSSDLGPPTEEPPAGL